MPSTFQCSVFAQKVPSTWERAIVNYFQLLRYNLKLISISTNFIKTSPPSQTRSPQFLLQYLVLVFLIYLNSYSILPCVIPHYLQMCLYLTFPTTWEVFFLIVGRLVYFLWSTVMYLPCMELHCTTQ